MGERESGRERVSGEREYGRERVWERERVSVGESVRERASECGRESE